MGEQERETYRISHRTGKQVSRSLVGNQAGIEKLVIGTRNDLNRIDQGTKNGTTKQIHGAGSPQRRRKQP